MPVCRLLPHPDRLAEPGGGVGVCDAARMTLRSGLWLPLFDALADPRVVMRLAAEAEEAGWDGVFVWDHLRWRSPVAAFGPHRNRGPGCRSGWRALRTSWPKPWPSSRVSASPPLRRAISM